MSEKADVFAFGVILWELLTGQAAFEEDRTPNRLVDAVSPPTSHLTPHTSQLLVL